MPALLAQEPGVPAPVAMDVQHAGVVVVVGSMQLPRVSRWQASSMEGVRSMADTGVCGPSVFRLVIANRALYCGAPLLGPVVSSAWPCSHAERPDVAAASRLDA